MCLACVGSCPEGALLDNSETPQLRFIETKCVQCGICAATCPEHAITLSPRLSLTPEARQPRVAERGVRSSVHTLQQAARHREMIGNMLARLAEHSMFAEAGALERLKMCADCRVIDMMHKGFGVAAEADTRTGTYRPAAK